MSRFFRRDVILSVLPDPRNVMISPPTSNVRSLYELDTVPSFKTVSTLVGEVDP